MNVEKWHMYLVLFWTCLTLVYMIYFVYKYIQLSFLLHEDQMNKNKQENFEDIYLSDIDGERNEIKRSTFPTFDFHAARDGHVQLGEFLMNWGMCSKKGQFTKPFTDAYGGLATPNNNNSGLDNVKVRDVSDDAISLRVESCERPVYFFAWGKNDDPKEKNKSKITVNSLYDKPEILKNFAYEEKKHENRAGSARGCKSTSRIELWHDDK